MENFSRFGFTVSLEYRFKFLTYNVTPGILYRGYVAKTDKKIKILKKFWSEIYASRFCIPNGKISNGSQAFVLKFEENKK